MFLLFNFNEIGDISISNLNMHFLSVTNFKPLTSNNPEWFLFCRSKFDYQKMTSKNFSALLSKFWKLRNQLNKDILKPVLLHEKIDWCWHKSQVKQTGNVIFNIINMSDNTNLQRVRSSHPEVFLRKGVLKICSKFTREHPCRSTISIKFQSNFIEITLRHRCSPVTLLHIFRTPFLNNAFGWLLLKGCSSGTALKT